MMIFYGFINKVIMADSVVIPQLHLFSSHRRHKSPTRDIIDYHNYKLTRNSIESIQKPIYSKPVLIPPIPIPIHVPPPDISIPIAYPPPIISEYIRAPTTYIDYAEQYLMGHRPPVLPSAQTARFSDKSNLNSFRAKEKYGLKCQCQTGTQTGTNTALSKNIYLHNRTASQIQRKQVNPPIVPQQIKKDPYFNVETQRETKKKHESPKIVINEPEKVPKQDGTFLQMMFKYIQECSEKRTVDEEQLQIFRNILIDMHQKQSKRKSQEQKNTIQEIIRYLQEQSNKNKITDDQMNIFKTIIDNSIVAENRRREEEHKNLIKGISSYAAEKSQQRDLLKGMINVGEQKVKQEEGKQVLIEKFMRKIPLTMDATRLEEIVSKKIQHFNNIRVDFQDLPFISMDELVEAKDQYMQSSKDILLKLNQLAGDRNQFSLICKFLKFKEKGQMSWPDI